MTKCLKNVKKHIQLALGRGWGRENMKPDSLIIFHEMKGK